MSNYTTLVCDHCGAEARGETRTETGNHIAYYAACGTASTAG